MLNQGKYSCPGHREESVVLCAQLVRGQFAYIASHEDEFSIGLGSNDGVLKLIQQILYIWLPSYPDMSLSVRTD